MGRVLCTGKAPRGASDETITFVETTLPPGVDAIVSEGIEYVTSVEAVDRLPSSVDALRAPGGRVFVAKP